MSDCDLMDYRTPGFPVLHSVPQFAHTLVHWVGDAIQPSHSVSPFSSCPQPFPASGSFPVSWLFASSGQVIGASTSFLPLTIQGWCSLGLTGWSSCNPRDSQQSSPASQFKSINSSAPSFLYGPNLISVHDYWKNHTFDYMDLCRQSDVSAF